MSAVTVPSYLTQEEQRTSERKTMVKISGI